MPTPFPGMDPYLEHPAIWRGVHTRLIVAIADELQALVRPRYRVEVEQRVYLAVLDPSALDDAVGIPDVLVMPTPEPALAGGLAATPAGVLPRVGRLPMPQEVKERFLEVRDMTIGQVVTVIELLSPTNKSAREGREQYGQKRLRVLGSTSNLVEIDLPRAGKPLPLQVEGNGLGSQFHYNIVVSRSWRRPLADVYLFTVRDPIPDFPIPLREGEPEPILPLNQLLHEVYDRAGYDLAIDYTRPPAPPLNETADR